MDMIVAVDLNWGIGYNGTQPVVIPEDRKFFRETTAGSTVIVGRRTLADFPGGRPLKNRRNIVLSSQKDLLIPDAEVVHGLDELKTALKDTDGKVFVIGGDSVYKLLMPYCEHAIITKICAAPEADRFIENLDESESWTLLCKGETKCHEGIEYSFDTYKNLNVKPL